MPKETKRTSTTKSSRTTSTKDAAGSKAAKDPKASHLFTDDNPSTTLTGTGFKDSETAIRTIDLVKSRSLIYQYQVINTMYNRAKSHPHPTPGIRAAEAIFKEWIDTTYPAARAALRVNGGFKPVLSKDIVLFFRNQMVDKGLKDDELHFVDFYVALGKNLRLGNQLLDNNRPGWKDWEGERYDTLCRIVPEGKDTSSDWEYDELWDEDKQPTRKHLDMIAWAWSPVSARTLASRVSPKG